ncbi:excinuclease ABC subunit UvrC [Fusobacterium sp. MFO224]|uniref:excinuclease ABC subunit UvrC n=1 Tax=Fusobacterium sp. MFO224 TaxID=3378070 RepID=UPI003853F384
MEIKKYNIPELPGVYLMKNDNQIIYVGKAKNLKKRVYSYFFSEQKSEKTKRLIENIDDIETIVCNSEVDAFILENNLIKKYSPKYNIQLKDEKTYPYIKISREKFPKISIIRTTKLLDRAKGDYFGPYPSGAFKLKDTMAKLFKIRDCNRDMNKKFIRPCLKYYMKFCSGPCINKNIEKKYNENVSLVKEILKGKGKKIIKELDYLMKMAAKNMEFEKAIIYREQKKEIEDTVNNQISEYGKGLDEDAFCMVKDGNRIFISVLNMRQGKILGKSSISLSLEGKIEDNIFLDVVRDYYTKHPIPNSIIFQHEYKENHELIEKWLKIKKKTKIIVNFPIKGGRRKEILNMAYLNLNADIINYYNKKSVIEESMSNLYNTLKLKRYPRKIECFDISNIQGKDAVASMSVSIEGRASKKDYRKYRIRSKDTPDDFQMMKEVIVRRYSKLKIEEFPDVILIDGGLGQINSVGKILQSIDREGISDLLSIAKREELIYKYGEKQPYKFSQSDEALKILIRVRDEAHRFGITYHRKLRKKRIIKSKLDEIEGIGEKRRNELLKYFGSVERIKNSTVEEISKIVPLKIAEKIFVKLKNIDNK